MSWRHLSRAAYWVQTVALLMGYLWIGGFVNAMGDKRWTSGECGSGVDQPLACEHVAIQTLVAAMWPFTLTGIAVSEAFPLVFRWSVGDGYEAGS